MTIVPRLPEQLISECQGLVHSLAKKIHRQAPPGVELEDLASYGQVILVR